MAGAMYGTPCPSLTPCSGRVVDDRGQRAVQGFSLFRTVNSSVPLPVRPSVFCTMMSNPETTAVLATSIVAISCVESTTRVDETVMPPGSLVFGR